MSNLVCKFAAGGFQNHLRKTICQQNASLARAAWTGWGLTTAGQWSACPRVEVAALRRPSESHPASKAGILGHRAHPLACLKPDSRRELMGPRLMSGMLSSVDVVLSQNTPLRGCSYMQRHLSGWQRGKALLRSPWCHLWAGLSWPWNSLWYKERPRTQQRHQLKAVKALLTFPYSL